MPLLDHFHEPMYSAEPWAGFHALWPAMMLLRLNRVLPEGYRAEPRVQIGTEYEIDVGALDLRQPGENGHSEHGGTAVLTTPEPTVNVQTALDEPDEFAVRVYAPGRILVAAVELVSPRNKDRPESRRAFTEKVGGLVRRGVSVSVVDIVGNAHFNLYADVLIALRHTDPALSAPPPPMYAVTCRTVGRRPDRRFQGWFRPLAVGQPLPVVPLWLSDDHAVDLDLELSYEDTRRALRLG
jgi:hypothetical protein